MAQVWQQCWRNKKRERFCIPIECPHLDVLVRDQIGTGLFSTVFVGCQLVNEVEVCNRAVKVIYNTEKEFVEQEANLQDKVSQYGIAPKVYQVLFCRNFKIGLERYKVGIIVMDLVEGMSLAKQQQILEYPNIQAMFVAMLRRLERAGVSHNDLHLDNVFLNKDKKLMLIDFGNATNLPLLDPLDIQSIRNYDAWLSSHDIRSFMDIFSPAWPGGWKGLKRFIEKTWGFRVRLYLYGRTDEELAQPEDVRREREKDIISYFGRIGPPLLPPPKISTAALDDPLYSYPQSSKGSVPSRK